MGCVVWVGYLISQYCATGEAFCGASVPHWGLVSSVLFIVFVFSGLGFVFWSGFWVLLSVRNLFLNYSELRNATLPCQ